jgi:hypothetical protein
MSSLADRVVELRKRATDIAANLISLAERRKERSLDAAIGHDKTAVEAIKQIDADCDRLKREGQTISAALELAEQKEREIAAEADRAQTRERAIEARKYADGLAALNIEIDSMMTQLFEAFQRRAILIAGLGGLVDPSFIARFVGKPGPTRAACHAGLHRFLALETVSPQAMRPLADANALLEGIGERPNKSQSNGS